jgi:hypothetical protein
MGENTTQTDIKRLSGFLSYGEIEGDREFFLDFVSDFTQKLGKISMF